MATKTIEPWFEKDSWQYQLVFERGDSNAIHTFFFPSKLEADTSYAEVFAAKDVIQDDAQQLKIFEKKEVAPKP